MVSTGGARASARRNKKQRTGSGLGDTGPWAASVARPVCLPVALFIFFLFLFLFPFSDFYLLHIICKNVSNQFKTISKSL
jgi:hypothetical protein